MKLLSIQMLRGLAALSVVAFHAAQLGFSMLGADEMAARLPLVSNMYSGVDVFFVISGFIMVFVTGERSRGPATAASFLTSRIVRIYPVWWLFAGLFTLYMLFANVLPTGAPGWEVLDNGEGPLLHLLKSYTLLPQDGYPVLAIGWTLTHEIYFYAVFAVTLLVAQRWLLPFLSLWGIAVLAGALAGLSQPLGTDLVSLAVHPLTLEFLLGALVALAVRSGRRWRPGLSAVLGAVWLAAMLAFVLPPTNTPPDAVRLLGPLQLSGHQVFLASDSDWGSFVLEWGRVIFFAPPTALIAYGLAGLEIEGRLPQPGALVALGDWSYALYLCHILVLAGLARILPAAFGIAEGQLGLDPAIGVMLGLTAPGPLSFTLFFALGGGLSILLAALVHRHFERPVMQRYAHVRNRFTERIGIDLKPAPVSTRIW